ncbi:MAG: hypothetical protein M1358_10490 [Chloroflexi bacterium]|nr:hypothetical protein [Chloroflexota bacterium]
MSIIVLLFLSMSACGSSGLLSKVGPLSLRVTPNGDGLDDIAYVSYTIGSRAEVTVRLTGPDGREHLLRDRVLRAADSYRIAFDGSVGEGGTENRQVLPDGQYRMTIEAVDLQGRRSSADVDVLIQDSDPVPLEVSDVVVQPQTISPNQDGETDEAFFSYRLSKKATVEVSVTDEEGRFHLLDPRKEREGALQPFEWNGTENGGKLLPDGDYTYHIRAWDKSGNVTEATGQVTLDKGGTPRLEIVDARFTPTSIPLGGVVKVRIKIKNVGDVAVKSDPEGGVGPLPGTAYTTELNFAHWRDQEGKPLYYERPGTWRVGVSWTNAPTPPPFPVRWSLGKDLQPGEEVEVTGEIQVRQKTREMYFWTTLVQEGVGYVGGNKGQTLVVVSY